MLYLDSTIRLKERTILLKGNMSTSDSSDSFDDLASGISGVSLSESHAAVAPAVPQHHTIVAAPNVGPPGHHLLLAPSTRSDTSSFEVLSTGKSSERGVPVADQQSGGGLKAFEVRDKQPTFDATTKLQIANTLAKVADIHDSVTVHTMVSHPILKDLHNVTDSMKQIINNDIIPKLDAIPAQIEDSTMKGQITTVSNQQQLRSQLQDHARQLSDLAANIKHQGGTTDGRWHINIEALSNLMELGEKSEAALTALSSMANVSRDSIDKLTRQVGQMRADVLQLKDLISIHDERQHDALTHVESHHQKIQDGIEDVRTKISDISHTLNVGKQVSDAQLKGLISALAKNSADDNARILANLNKNITQDTFVKEIDRLEDDIAQLISNQQPPDYHAIADLVVNKLVEMDEKQLASSMQKVLQQAETESLIANAVAKGLGSMAGSTIVGLIFQGILAPFKEAHEVSGIIDDAAGAVSNVVAAIDKAADVAQKSADTYKQIADTTTGLVDTIKSSNSELANQVKAQGGAAYHLTAADFVDNHEPKWSQPSNKKKGLHSQTVLGDHSIHMPGVMDTRSNYIDFSSNIVFGADWYTHMYKSSTAWGHQVDTDDDGQFYLRNEISTFDETRRARPPVTLTGTVIHCMHNINAVQLADMVSFNMREGKPVCDIKEEVFAALLTSGMPNERTISNIIGGKLVPLPPQVIRDACMGTNLSVQVWDNSFMYCKMVAIAMVLDHVSLLPDGDITMEPFNVDVNIVNLSGAGVTADDLLNPIYAGRICFVERSDWNNTAANLQLLYWLSSASYPFIMTNAQTNG